MFRIAEVENEFLKTTEIHFISTDTIDEKEINPTVNAFVDYVVDRSVEKQGSICISTDKYHARYIMYGNCTVRDYVLTKRILFEYGNSIIKSAKCRHEPGYEEYVITIEAPKKLKQEFLKIANLYLTNGSSDSRKIMMILSSCRDLHYVT